MAMKNGAVHCRGSVAEVVTEARLHDLFGLDFEILRSEQGFVCNYFNPSPSREPI